MVAVNSFGGCGGPFLCWGELERAAGGQGAVGTLLGPERTGEGVSLDIPERVSFLGLHLFPYHSFLVGSVCSGLAGVGFWRGVGWGFRLLFENCTVDASIFVAKFLRAHGGCLGTRSR